MTKGSFSTKTKRLYKTGYFLLLFEEEEKIMVFSFCVCNENKTSWRRRRRRKKDTLICRQIVVTSFENFFWIGKVYIYIDHECSYSIVLNFSRNWNELNRTSVYNLQCSLFVKVTKFIACLFFSILSTHSSVTYTDSIVKLANHIHNKVACCLFSCFTCNNQQVWDKNEWCNLRSIDKKTS